MNRNHGMRFESSDIESAVRPRSTMMKTSTQSVAAAVSIWNGDSVQIPERKKKRKRTKIKSSITPRNTHADGLGRAAACCPLTNKVEDSTMTSTITPRATSNCIFTASGRLLSCCPNDI